MVTRTIKFRHIIILAMTPWLILALFLTMQSIVVAEQPSVKIESVELPIIKSESIFFVDFQILVPVLMDGTTATMKEVLQ